MRRKNGARVRAYIGIDLEKIAEAQDAITRGARVSDLRKLLLITELEAKSCAVYIERYRTLQGY